MLFKYYENTCEWKNIVKIRVDEKILWKLTLWCLNNENCLNNNIRHQISLFKILRGVNLVTNYNL